MLKLPRARGPGTVSPSQARVSPAGPEIARFTQERRHWPWNYMQMSSTRAHRQAAWQTPALGTRSAGFQTGISVINCSLRQAACHLAQRDLKRHRQLQPPRLRGGSPG